MQSHGSNRTVLFKGNWEFSNIGSRVTEIGLNADTLT